MGNVPLRATRVVGAPFRAISTLLYWISRLVPSALCSIRKIVKPRRVVDQDAPQSRRLGRPLLEQLEQAPGIRHFAFDARMRPVAAPDQAIGVGAHQRLVERPRVGIVRRASAEP